MEGQLEHKYVHKHRVDYNGLKAEHKQIKFIHEIGIQYSIFTHRMFISVHFNLRECVPS